MHTKGSLIINLQKGGNICFFLHYSSKQRKDEKKKEECRNCIRQSVQPSALRKIKPIRGKTYTGILYELDKFSTIILLATLIICSSKSVNSFPNERKRMY